jgi:hypothetical protein
VARQEELVQENLKEVYGRIHLAGLHHGVKKCLYVNMMGLAYILAPLSGKAKSAQMGRSPLSNPGWGIDWAFPLSLIPSITTPQAAEPRQEILPIN